MTRGSNALGTRNVRTVLGGRKDDEAMGLKAPELVIIDQIIKLLGNGRAPLLVGCCTLKLLESVPRHVL
jgi:hypothetical protein